MYGPLSLCPYFPALNTSHFPLTPRAEVEAFGTKRRNNNTQQNLWDEERFIIFHSSGIRRRWARRKVRDFLTHLAVERKVAASRGKCRPAGESIPSPKIKGRRVTALTGQEMEKRTLKQSRQRQHFPADAVF